MGVGVSRVGLWGRDMIVSVPYNPFLRSGASRAGSDMPCCWCRIALAGPRRLAGQKIVRAPGDADEVSRPGSDRWRCPFWLGFWLIVGHLLLYVKCLNYQLYSRGGSTGMDPQISPWGGYCVGLGANWTHLLG